MRRKIGVAIAVLLLSVCLCLAGYSGYQLYESHEAYAEGDETYEHIAQQVVSLEPTSVEEPQEQELAAGTTKEPEETEQEIVAVPGLNVDFAALGAINQDAVAWLYCPDTVISYPIMAAEDYSYYLHYLPDGTYNINGSLFLDYNGRTDFSDRLSVVYGHNMKSGKMFGSLDSYKKQSYFEEHPYLYLYTQSQNYRIALVYGAVISADQWTQEGYMLSQNADALLAYASAHTTFQSPAVQDLEDDPQQNLVVLSTCSYEFDGARYFVVGLLQPATSELPQ
jgi:sortase B